MTDQSFPKVKGMLLLYQVQMLRGSLLGLQSELIGVRSALDKTMKKSREQEVKIEAMQRRLDQQAPKPPFTSLEALADGK